MPHPTITALRSLVDTRFPATTRKPGDGVPTGVGALDEILGGGLPRGRLTELVSSRANCGGQLVQTQLLIETRAARRRMVLIDAADAFVPDSVPPDALRHLVWVRPDSLERTLAAADLLLRDGNYAVIVLDFRGISERRLRRVPAPQWHRLHRAAEQNPAAVLVQTSFNLVPAVAWRLALTGELGWAARRRPRAELLGCLRVEAVRGHRAAAWEELAG